MEMKYYSPILLLLLVASCKPSPSSTDEPVIVPDVADTLFRDLIGKDYLIDDQHSYLGFKIKYFGYSPVRGRFNEFDGTVFFDTANITSLSTSLFIDIRSINTGNERRDNDLKSEGTWFDAAAFPDASFESQQVVPKENGAFDLIGKLTIKDSTRIVTLEFDKPTGISRDWAQNEQIDFEGSAIINRQDFGIYGGDFWSSVMENGLTQLSDEVELELNIHCRRPDYLARYDDMDSTDIRKVLVDKIRIDGIDATLPFIQKAYNDNILSSGGMSTIGYILNGWSNYQDAVELFKTKEKLFGESASLYNQIGITQLHMRNDSAARSSFEKSLELDATNSRASEYLRLIRE